MAVFAKVQDRTKLKPRRDPYWAKVRKGCFLGFRKMASDSAGTWSARCLDENAAKQVHKALGSFEEVPDQFRYDAAQKEALIWFDHLGQGGAVRAVTVRQACQKYVDHLRETKSERTADDAGSRFKRYVFNDPRLSNLELAKLMPTHLEAWRKTVRKTPILGGAGRGGQRSDSSLNRDMTCLRAALNHAFRDGWVTSDFAWRGKLRPVKNADRRRDVYIDIEQRRKLVAHADTDLAGFLRGMSLIPLRPGALAALTVASYDQRLKTLTVGKDKAGQDRKIMLPDATAAFFATHCKGKLPSAPLLARANGKHWDKDAWKYPIKSAVIEAELPDSVTCYALRHSVITDMIHGGLDTMSVAQLSGTSVLMIERHYGHLTEKHARAALARLAL